MRISECWGELKGQRDSEVYEFTNKQFEYTVQMYTKEWTMERKFYKDGNEVDIDSIPDGIFAAMMQNDNWNKKC